MRVVPSLMLVALLAYSLVLQAAPVGTSFTYQGELQQSGIPTNGSFDFEL